MGNWGLVGHEWAIEALRRAIARQHVPHALLFVGPPGVGKSTLARTFSRALECTAPDPASRPCGVCRPCVQIAANNYPDVRMIETERGGSGARQDRRDISIDQIRALQHQVSLKPYEGQWVIGIIADANDMSDAAANCLLKTLEEPQIHAVLILTAPDVGLLLPTIVSRCQVFPLRPLAVEEAASALSARLAIPSEQAEILAHLSGGRIGWALQAAGDESVLAERRQKLDILLQLMETSRGKRLEQAAALSEEYGRGQDGRDAVHGTLDLWVTWWRDLLLVKEGCAGQVTNADRTEDLQRTSSSHSAGEVARALADLIAARSHLERNVNPRLALEALMLSLPDSSRRQNSA